MPNRHVDRHIARRLASCGGMAVFALPVAAAQVGPAGGRLRAVGRQQMIHPDTELRPASAAIGLGVFATRTIPKGTIVWVLDQLDQRLSPERMKRLGEHYGAILDRYGWTTATGERVLCWDLARWINHSCEPNVLSSGWDFDVAVCDIEAGTELTSDYGALNLEGSFACCCGAPACRGQVHPGDFERFAEQWDARVREALPTLTRVSQPLWRWVPAKRTVSAASRKPERAPSVLSHRWRGPGQLPARRISARDA